MLVLAPPAIDSIASFFFPKQTVAHSIVPIWKPRVDIGAVSEGLRLCRGHHDTGEGPKGRYQRNLVRFDDVLSLKKIESAVAVTWCVMCAGFEKMKRTPLIERGPNRRGANKRVFGDKFIVPPPLGWYPKWRASIEGISIGGVSLTQPTIMGQQSLTDVGETDGVFRVKRFALHGIILECWQEDAECISS